MNRLLITGASGKLGKVCRARLTHMADVLRLSDIADLGSAADDEELVPCDLGTPAAVHDLVKDCDGVIHMGGKSTEGPWEIIQNANINGTLNLYEACRSHGVRRIFFASSNHATGFYKQTDRLDASVPVRPDGLYGVSKIFGEGVARLYFDRFGIETACVRIGSCFPRPSNERMLSTWLSHDDLIRLIERVFKVPHLGCPVIYGASNNDRSWWDNRLSAHVGWIPKDNAQDHHDDVSRSSEGQGVGTVFQGGACCEEEIKL